MNGLFVVTIPASIAPEQLAIKDERHAWTYAALLERAQQYARHLQQVVAVGDTVAILLTNSTQYMAAILGCWASGVIAMPINNRSSQQELDVFLQDAQYVITEQRYRDFSFAVPAFVVGQDQFLSGHYEEREYEVAFYLYTSGSSGTPKKVRIFHEVLSGYILNHQDTIDGTDKGVYLNTVPLFHITGLTAVLNALFAGRTVIMQEGFHAQTWLQTIQQEHVTHTFVVPTMLYDLLQHPQLETCCTSLTHMTYGGAPMPVTLIRQAIERLPHIAFSNAFGLTETTATIAVLTPEDHQLHIGNRAQKERRLASVGRVVEDVIIRIRRGDTICLPNEEGIIEVATSRLNHYAHTLPTEWFVTHDVGYVDEDGYLFITGRSSDVIVRGGENIMPQSIEAVLLQHEAIEQVIVFGVEDARWGQRVAAAIICNDDVCDEALQAYVKGYMASFQVPQQWIRLTEMPLNATGKIDRRRLQQLACQTEE